MRHAARSSLSATARGVDLTLGSFDDPAGFVPTAHAGAESMHEAWIDTHAPAAPAQPTKPKALSAGGRQHRARGAAMSQARVEKGCQLRRDRACGSSARRRRPGADAARAVLERGDELDPLLGTPAKLAAAGFEAIMPDLRAHGASGKPHDPAGLPRRRAGARCRGGGEQATGAHRFRPRRFLARCANGGAGGGRRAGAAAAGARRNGARRAFRAGTGARRSSSMRSTGSPK